MTTSEFSDQFDVLLNSYSKASGYNEEHSNIDVVLDEYEKSVFLTKAQQEVVIELYNGKNPYGDSFEDTEELRRYLDGLVTTKVYTENDKLDNKIGLYSSSSFFALPEDLAFITLEQVTFSDSDNCINNVTAKVYPITQDEYASVKDNPFRGPTRYKALRLDYGNNTVELISTYSIGKYLIKYLRKPRPIILVDLPNELKIENKTEKTESEVNPLLHQAILTRAVILALRSKGISYEK